MAWIKEWLHPDTGARGEYWEKETILYNHRTQLSELRVSVWADKQNYDSGMRSMHTLCYIIPSGLAPQLAAGASQFIEGYVRALPEFQGSQDAS